MNTKVLMQYYPMKAPFPFNLEGSGEAKFNLNSLEDTTFQVSLHCQTCAPIFHCRVGERKGTRLYFRVGPYPLPIPSCKLRLSKKLILLISEKHMNTSIWSE